MSEINSTQYNKLYSKRPETPLGEAYGLTSAPVSQSQSRHGSPPINYYQYQPAMTWTHPHVFEHKTHNYNDACASEQVLTAKLAPQCNGAKNGTAETAAEGLKTTKTVENKEKIAPELKK